MGLESLKFYVTTYIIFVILLSAFDLQAGINLGIPNPPAFSGVGILGDDMQALITSLQESNPLLWLIGGAVQLIAILISVVIFVIGWLFYLFTLFVIWTIPNQPFINLFLLLYRILMFVELLPYIKNLIHPTTGATH